MTNLDPDVDYRATALFDTRVRMGDGSVQHTGSARFAGGQMVATVGTVRPPRRRRHNAAPRPTYQYLAIELRDVDPVTVVRVPDGLSRNQRLLRESLYAPPGAGFAFEACVTVDDVCHVAPACVLLETTGLRGRQANAQMRERFRVVEDASRQGLMTAGERDRATFRINLEAVRNELDAMLDSGYVPDDCWALRLWFGYWRRVVDDEAVDTPLTDDTRFPGAAKIRFRPCEVARDLQVSDLFA